MAARECASASPVSTASKEPLLRWSTTLVSLRLSGRADASGHSTRTDTFPIRHSIPEVSSTRSGPSPPAVSP